MKEHKTNNGWSNICFFIGERSWRYYNHWRQRYQQRRRWPKKWILITQTIRSHVVAMSIRSERGGMTIIIMTITKRMPNSKKNPPFRHPKRRGSAKHARPKGCTNKIIANGVCAKHGAAARTCSVENCTNNAISGDKYMVHPNAVRKTVQIKLLPRVCVGSMVPKKSRGIEWGVVPLILMGSDVPIAVQAGLCKRHGAKVAQWKMCTAEDCTHIAVRGGVCVKHGAKLKRRFTDCVNGMVPRFVYARWRVVISRYRREAFARSIMVMLLLNREVFITWGSDDAKK